MRPKRKRKNMYAVSGKGVGIVAGTIAYSRSDAICLFQGPDVSRVVSSWWAQSKRGGYRTVKVAVRIIP